METLTLNQTKSKVSSRSIRVHHEKCLDIIESIQHYERQKESLEYDLTGLGRSFFPELESTWKRQLKVYERCISILHVRLNKLNKNFYQ